MTETPQNNGRLLIYAPVSIYGTPEGWFIEKQAANGLRLWAENFDHVTVMMPHQDGPAPVGWIPAANIGPNLARVNIVPLPTAWVLSRFAKVYYSTRDTIRQENPGRRLSVLCHWRPCRRLGRGGLPSGSCHGPPVRRVDRPRRV